MQALTSFPFTSDLTYDANGWPQLDRATDSEGLRKLINNYFTDGILLTADSTYFQVSASNDGAALKVSPGVCLVRGATGYITTESTIELPASDLSLPRIDTVVLRLNDNHDYRNIYIDIITGTPASTPTAPALTRSGSIYELGIANIYRTANSTAISNSNITDTRADSERCGQVNAIDKIDTVVFQQQFNALYEEQQADFITWFDYIKGQLSEDVATNLQNQIGILSELTTSDKTNIVSAVNEIYSNVEELQNIEDIISDAFSASTAYAKGEYCIYNNTLYKFTAAHPAGPWTGTDVESVTVADEITNLNSNLNKEWNSISFQSSDNVYTATLPSDAKEFYIEFFAKANSVTKYATPIYKTYKDTTFEINYVDLERISFRTISYINSSRKITSSVGYSVTYGGTTNSNDSVCIPQSLLYR